MAILVFLTGVVIALLVFLTLGVQIIKTVGLFALGLFALSLVGIVYVSLAIGGITLFALHELWGGQHFSGAIAIAGITGLTSGALMLRGVMSDIAKMADYVRRWLGGGKTEPAVPPALDAPKQISRE
ncbi:hypothetical protein FACS1894158_18450 [Betaproteobacteria bacterium]|nr:hypothetical protein FACS1894158_18450 [Betaproteobacteria bacterium]